jgi:3-oxoacyl-[acyl-carrier protein] reductase
MPEEEVTEEVYDRVFDLNTKGQFFVAQQAYKHLPKYVSVSQFISNCHNCQQNLQGGGRIILMSSVAATMSGIPNHALYAGSKAAIGGFVRSFAKDFGPSGITVNAIAPGGIKTDMYTANSWHYVPGGYEGMPTEVIDRGLVCSQPYRVFFIDFANLGRLPSVLWVAWD